MSGRTRVPGNPTVTASISTGEIDQIERTANRVRLVNSKEVHALARRDSEPMSGLVYDTVCGELLFASAGAMLTTRPVTCEVCLPAPTVRRARR